MLGIMNCNDVVEFYSANEPDKSSSDESNKSSTHLLFDDARQRQRKLSYTNDGRRLVDGQPTKDDVDNYGPNEMWTELLQRSVSIKLHKVVDNIDQQTSKIDNDNNKTTTVDDVGISNERADANRPEEIELNCKNDTNRTTITIN